MTELNIDFETASEVDLIKEGVYLYASDPTTRVLMMAWAFDDEEPEVWEPPNPFPRRVTDHVRDGGRINAANAAFERLIWWYVLRRDILCGSGHPIPEPKLEQFYCTLYKARCNNMPASLDKLARALGIFNQKTAARGKELIKLWCILDSEGYCAADDIRSDHAKLFWQEFRDYCAQDVRAEREAAGVLREPTEEEWEDYFVSERINDRGVRIDYDLAKAATAYATEEQEELQQWIVELTDGAVDKVRGEKLKAWVLERLTEDEQRPMVRYKTVDGEKVKKYSLDKSAREELLEMDLDPVVLDVIDASDMAQKSSVSKFKTMMLRADPQTDRVQGAFMANGASGTGRYSSKGLQCHNFTRNVLKPDLQAEAIEDLMDNVHPEDMVAYFGMPIMHLLSRMLRAAIIPGKGKRLVVVDWSAIEGRVAPWLTCSNAGNKKLQLYLDGVDTYLDAATGIYHEVVDDPEDPRRQVGKVAELSLQFGGGENAFLGMARNYGVKMSREEAAEVKINWRAANTWAPDMWERIETAAFSAIRAPGTIIPVGKVNYFAVEGLYGFDMTMFCELPCGRVLTYPDIRESTKPAPWDDSIKLPSLSAMRAGWTPKVGAKQWPRGGVYGGLMFENIVQGTAASILRWTLRELDFEQVPTILHVHDEPVAEVPEDEAEEVLELMTEIMEEGPAWAEGLPLKAEGQIMKRYGK